MPKTQKHPGGRPTKYTKELEMAKTNQDLNCSGIYALKENGTIRYIGQAKHIGRRYNQHKLLAQNRGNTKRQTWLNKLLVAGGELQIEVLEVTQDLDSAEIMWIKKLRDSGLDLVNSADGGKTMTHCNRAKQDKPWGKTWSPVQRRLIEISQTAKMLKRIRGEDSKEAARIEARLIEVNQKIKRVGLEKMNNLLWEKYGY